MKHARSSYNRIQDPHNLIPEDEPVFLLRAQDICAAPTLEFWADLVESLAGPCAIADLARQQAVAMRLWTTKKIPDASPDDRYSVVAESAVNEVNPFPDNDSSTGP